LAITFDQKIDPRIKAERSVKLRQLSTIKRQSFYKIFVNKTLPVLFESTYSDGTVSGLTEEYIRVDIKSKSLLTNKIINVTIKEASADKCFGIISETSKTPAIRVAI
jgi:threonylcarbamoyladenosine tRNA methylthiotransferase MtaB